MVHAAFAVMAYSVVHFTVNSVGHTKACTMGQAMTSAKNYSFRQLALYHSSF